MTTVRSHIFRSLLSLLIVAGSIGVFLWLGKAKPPPSRTPKTSAPIVQVVAAETYDQPLTFKVDGFVVPFRQIQLAAQVSGRVIEKSDNCRTGRRVRKGDRLIQIDPTDYQIEIRRLAEERNAAVAQMGELDSEITSAANRIESLAKQVELDARQTNRMNEMIRRKAASQSELDATRRIELTTRNEYQSLVDQKRLLESRKTRLKATAALADANLEKAELSLERTELVAPIDGMVATDLVEEDGYVQAGTVVVTLQDIDQLDVICQIRMGQMNWLWAAADERKSEDKRAFPSTPARVRVAIGDDIYQWAGTVNRYDGAGIDEQTRMVPCRVNIPQPDAPKLVSKSTLPSASKSKDGRTVELLTGMFTTVLVDVSPPKSLVRLPHAAVQPGAAVWAVRSGKLQRVEIDLVSDDANYVIVAPRQGGLRIDDKVVVSPLATPVDGTDVVIEGSAEEIQMIADQKSNSRKKTGGKR